MGFLCIGIEFGFLMCLFMKGGICRSGKYVLVFCLLINIVIEGDGFLYILFKRRYFFFIYWGYLFCFNLELLVLFCRFDYLFGWFLWISFSF